MAKREKKHPTKKKAGNRDFIVGAEIDYPDSWDLIKDHAKKQLEAGEEIGLILVSIQKSKSSDLRFLAYTALTPGNESGVEKPRGYKISDDLITPPDQPLPVDKIETVTFLHQNPWCGYVPGLGTIWVC